MVQTRTQKQSPNIALKNDTVNVEIIRYMTDTDGAIVAPGFVPPDLPVFVFGAFDFKGGYKAGQLTTPLNLVGMAAIYSNTEYLTTFINGVTNTSEGILGGGYSNLNQIKNLMKPGDIVTVYVNDRNAPSYFFWLVQTSLKQSLGSILQNINQDDNGDERIYIENVLYNVITGIYGLPPYGTYTPDRQYNFPIHVTSVNKLGKFKDHTLLPTIYRPPANLLTNVIRIPFPYKLDQYIGFYTTIDYATYKLQLTFNVKN